MKSVRWLPLALLIAATFAQADIAVTDDRGQALRLAQPAQRIVSLAPHITELLFAAGAGSKLVGTVAYSDYPDAALRIPRVGDARTLDLERLAALQPDLVIVWHLGNAPRQIEALQTLGLPVYHHHAQRLEQIGESIRTFGRMAGTEDAAQPAARAFSERLQALREHFAQGQQVSVFVQIWSAPLMTVNGQHLISDVLAACGGHNVFGGLPMQVPQPSIEAVLQADPEVIVATGTAGDESEIFGLWQAWPQLKAVARGNLLLLPPEQITRNTPRLLDGAQALCHGLETARSKRDSKGPR
jgi:iron complex transport system substrate-binding protein